MQTQGSKVARTQRPAISAFKQQKFSAWQPSFTPQTVLPPFFLVGIVFISIGVTLLHLSNQVKEIVVDYTKCNKVGTTTSCSDLLANNSLKNCECKIEFEIDEDILGDVYLYYGLSNYYQNHRHYVKSRDDNQLQGNVWDTPSEDCKPFDITNSDKPIIPCGAIANSLFNDTLTITWQVGNKPVTLMKTGIAWPSDKEGNFKNPPDLNDESLRLGSAKPIAWEKNFWELDTEDENNNGLQNEEFIVWMRTAALPTFRKLYRVLNRTDSDFKNGLKRGRYILNVNYKYPVKKFNGTKKMILSTMSLVGGKNPFLGIAYIVTGSACTLFGLILLILQVWFGRKISRTVNPIAGIPLT